MDANVASTNIFGHFVSSQHGLNRDVKQTMVENPHKIKKFCESID